MKLAYQFKITLKNINPPVWRRILVSEKYSFWDLHVAIQDAMGWQDSHLHVFRMRRKHSHKPSEIGIPYESFTDEIETLPGWKIPIKSYFIDIGNSCEYEYDFGDCWQHEILFEGILLWEKGEKYPKCLDGQRACPPEDCGGVSGYLELLETIADPASEDHERMVEWIGGDFDPEEFKKEKVKFDIPGWRWKKAFEQG